MSLNERQLPRSSQIRGIGQGDRRLWASLFFSKLTAFLFLLAAVAKAESPAAGPIENHDLFPLALLHLQAVPIGIETVPTGDLELAYRRAWSNSFVDAPGYVVDAEIHENDFGGRFGLSDKVDIGLQLPVYNRGGGMLDSTIHHFHSIVGLPDGGRESADNDDYHIAIKGEGGKSIQVPRAHTGFGNPVASIRYHFAPHVAAISNLSLPSLSSTHGHQGLDFSLGLVSEYRWYRWNFWGGGSGVALGDREVLGISYEQLQFHGFLGTGYEIMDGMAGVVQLSGRSKFITNIPDFPERAFNLDFGLRFTIGTGVVEAILTENPASGDSSPDISGHISVIFRWV